MITLQKLEKAYFKAVHDFEFQVLDYPLTYQPKSGTAAATAALEESWKLLYWAAKNGSVSVLDALYLIRHSGHAMNVFLNDVIDQQDYEEAKLHKYHNKGLSLTYSDESAYCYILVAKKIYSVDDLQKLKAAESDDEN